MGLAPVPLVLLVQLHKLGLAHVRLLLLHIAKPELITKILLAFLVL